MKRSKANIYWIAIIIMLIVALIGFYLYDVLYLHTPYTEHLFRTFAAACLLLGTLIRLTNGGKRKNLQMYEKIYEAELGTAFDSQPVLRKKLLCACRLYDESNFGKALKYLFQLLSAAQSVNDSVPVLLFIALCFTDAGVHDEAIKAYSELLKIDPDDARVHSNMGTLLVNMGDLEAALEHYNRSIELKPENYYAYINRANYFFRKGEYDLAANDAKQALEFKNNGAEAASLLTVVYALQGDEEQQKHYYHIAITSGKNPKDLNEAIEYYLNENKSEE